MKVLICVNRFLATRYSVELGTVVDIREQGAPLCEHESRHYDAIPLSDEVWREIEPHWNNKETLIYDHNKGQVRVKWL